MLEPGQRDLLLRLTPSAFPTAPRGPSCWRRPTGSRATGRELGPTRTRRGGLRASGCAAPRPMPRATCSGASRWRTWAARPKRSRRGSRPSRCSRSRRTPPRALRPASARADLHRDGRAGESAGPARAAAPDVPITCRRDGSASIRRSIRSGATRDSEAGRGHGVSADPPQRAARRPWRTATPLERELGRGGMATVYLAPTCEHERPVALKVLHPELAASLGPERFLREIKLAARLQHPHILTVLDSGEAAGPALVHHAVRRGRDAARPAAARAPAPGRRRAADRARGGAARSTTPTSTAWSTATSSPRTCCSPATATRWSPTSGSPARSAAERRAADRRPAWPSARRPT